MDRKTLLCLALLLAAVYAARYTPLPGGTALVEGPRPRVHAYFCPEDGCSGVVVRWISRANRSIDLAIYSFTLDTISRALIEAKERGVRVRVIMEAERIDRYSEYGRLKAAGVEVRPDGNRYLMHDKFMVIDGRVVLTGSFNYTWSADRRNDENLVVIEDERVARAFESEFDEMWSGVFGR